MTAEWVPWVNLCLGSIGYGWLLGRTAIRWGEYPDELRWLFRLTLALFGCLLLVSAVMIQLEQAPLSSAVAISVVKVYALRVLWKTRSTKYRTGTRTADGDPGADQNRDVP